MTDEHKLTRCDSDLDLFWTSDQLVGSLAPVPYTGPQDSLKNPPTAPHPSSRLPTIRAFLLKIRIVGEVARRGFVRRLERGGAKARARAKARAKPPAPGAGAAAPPAGGSSSESAAPEETSSADSTAALVEAKAKEDAKAKARARARARRRVGKGEREVSRGACRGPGARVSVPAAT